MSPVMLSFQTADLLDELSRRDVALWIRGASAIASTATGTLTQFLGLPWRFVLADSVASDVIGLVGSDEDPASALVSKRGFVQLVNDRPSQIELPQRCLPIYVLDGTRGTAGQMETQLRRLEMLMLLASASIRRLLVVSFDADPVPPELIGVWESGLRAYVSFVSGNGTATTAATKWAERVSDSQPIVALRSSPPEEFAAEVVEAYARAFARDSARIRVRDERGGLELFDVLHLDNPDHPVLDGYTIVQDKDLRPLLPEDITAQELESFFLDPSQSWRPYAAGLVWGREVSGDHDLLDLMAKLDDAGAEENCIAYVACESGAGGTTYVRNLAWECASRGYPVLVAGRSSQVADALRVSNFMNRVYEEVKGARLQVSNPEDSTRSPKKPYETPWVIVFDAVNWAQRDPDLRRFIAELRRDGRPVCVLLVVPPQPGHAVYGPDYRNVGELGHTISEEEALRLGRHLNRFLSHFKKERSEAQWRTFYRRHTADEIGGIAAFWVVLSFWLTRQFDLSETFQSILYRTFRECTDRDDVRRALVYISALSTERLPVPHTLLPESDDDWPTFQHLEDERRSLGALGLTRVEGERGGWILVHDVLGRLLLNAVHQDQRMVAELGFPRGEDPIHFRLLVLANMARRQELGHVEYRELGDQFATSVFKIDPDHGKGEFLAWWRDVLNVLDDMPSGLRRSSRVFLHHSAISRRRIAKFDARLTYLSTDDQVDLLNDAVRDIAFALENVEYKAGTESDLNLLNSLAHAYMDVAEAEKSRGANEDLVRNLREQAQEAAHRAYQISPANSFAIETFVRNLLMDADQNAHVGVENCTRALGVLFAAIASDEESYRQAKLDHFAGRAVRILMRYRPDDQVAKKPVNAVDVLVNAWVALCADMDLTEFSLEDVPKNNRVQAIEALGHEVGRGHAQVVRLTYELVAMSFPADFSWQLACLEQLQGVAGSGSLQERLEYAILLYQTGRARDGDRIFAELRRSWRQGEHFVQVPARLRMLRDSEGRPKVVQASVVGDWIGRPMAQVRDLRDCRAVFRPEEFDSRDVVPGRRFSCLVSFGQNGAFLRPATARIS